MTPIVTASCIILDDYGRVLLLHRDEGEGSYWDLPSGLVEDEEDTPEMVILDSAYRLLGASVTLVGSLGNETVETDDAAYQYFWFQAAYTQPGIQTQADGDYDDIDYFELEDMPSLALSLNMLTLYPKIYSGEISLDSTL